MMDKRAVVDSCTPPLDSIAFSEPGDGDRGIGKSNGADERVEYTLKPATRAYASTARYITRFYKMNILYDGKEEESHVLSGHVQA